MMKYRYIRVVAVTFGILILTGATLAMTVRLSPIATGRAAAPTFKNPVYKKDFPDPFVLKVGKTYYAYATNTTLVNVPTLTSTDLVHWKPGADAMPKTGSWATSNIWAPDIIRRADGKYVLYYTGRFGTSGRQCIGHAISDGPGGPFVDSSSKPFICQLKQGGDIDADAYKDSKGALYLVYKNDGNCCGQTTNIYAQRLASDGMKLMGKASIVETNNDIWEGSVTEGPEMRQHAGVWYLFYSGGDYASTFYAEGYATCRGPLGPCVDGKENPILHTVSNCSAAGPGGATLITDAKGQWWIIYHAWRKDSIGYNPGSPGRSMWMDRMTWRHGKPVVHGPTCTPQPAPTT